MYIKNTDETTMAANGTQTPSTAAVVGSIMKCFKVKYAGNNDSFEVVGSDYAFSKVFLWSGHYFTNLIKIGI